MGLSRSLRLRKAGDSPCSFRDALPAVTFKDQMKAAGKSSDAPTPESEDIAKLLRALNDDLKADPIDDVADLEDDDDEPKAARGGLPLGKIAAALLAAAGIGFAVVMLDPGGSPPSDPSGAATTSLVPPAPAITRAPAANTANPAPESLIARAPAAATPALPVPPPAAPAPTPPAGAAPMAPPPALKAPEPPALPPTAAPASTARPAPVAKLAEPPHAAPPPAQTAAAPAPAAPPPPAAPAPKAVEPAPAKPAEPPTAKAETGALQAMLAPPKDPREPVKRPPPPAKPAEVKAPEPKAPEPKPAAVAKPLAPATGTLTVPIQSTPAAQPPAAPTASSAASDDAVPSGRYSVQVGSYQVAENAAIQVQKLKKSGYAAFGLDWTDSANKTWHVVRVGGYADKAAAQRAADDLKAKMGLPAYPVSAR